MIDLIIPLIILNLTIMILFFIEIFNNNKYYSYFEYPIDKLIKLSEFEMNKLYNLNRTKFKIMINFKHKYATFAD